MVNPPIEVLIPVHNRVEMLRQTLHSLAAQVDIKVKVILIDDFSDDSPSQLVGLFPELEFLVLRNSEKLGVAKSLNIGVEASKEEFVARLDADDIAHPHRFKKQVEFLRSNTQVGLVGSNVEYFGTIRGTTSNLPLTQSDILVAGEAKNPIAHPSVMFRRDMVSSVNGPYDPKYEGIEDWELWSRLVGITEICNLPEPLTSLRLHDDQYSRGQVPSAEASLLIAKRFRSARKRLGKKSLFGPKLGELGRRAAYRLQRK